MTVNDIKNEYEKLKEKGLPDTYLLGWLDCALWVIGEKEKEND